jgi:drug/metabolite transporter (DMT)-like permease
VAVQAARVGITTTLMAMSPVLSLPLVHWIFHERISPRAILGTLIAMSGVVLMILV